MSGVVDSRVLFFELETIALTYRDEEPPMSHTAMTAPLPGLPQEEMPDHDPRNPGAPGMPGANPGRFDPGRGPFGIRELMRDLSLVEAYMPTGNKHFN